MERTGIIILEALNWLNQLGYYIWKAPTLVVICSIVFCYLAVLLTALIFRPAQPGKMKFYWLFGVLETVVYNTIAFRLELPTIDLRLAFFYLLLVVPLLWLGEYLLLKRYAKTERRMIAALGVQSLLMVVLYYLSMFAALFVLFLGMRPLHG